MRTNPKPSVKKIKRDLAVARLETTYIEKSDKKNLAEVGALMAGGLKDVDSGLADAKAAGKLLVAGVRKVWSGGRKFALAEDQNQMAFNSWWETAEDWKRDAERRVKIDTAKKIYRATPDAAPTSLEECKAAIQPMLVLTGDLPRPARALAQESHEEQNLWTEMSSQASTLESYIVELKKKHPLDRMQREELEKFVRSTKLVHDEHDAAALELSRRPVEV